MNNAGASGLDITGFVILALALAALVWSMRRRTVAHTDEEASAVLWADDEAVDPRDVAAATKPPRRISVLMIALFVLIAALMTIIPTVTVIMAQHAQTPASSGR
jgi:hypothetical protein